MNEAHAEGAFICKDGGQLRYQMWGTGEPVVLIHGLGLDASMWDPQWPVLRQEFRAIRYDVRGFGGSSLPHAPYSHSEDLLDLLNFTDARPAHVIGMSMGGRLALRFALEQPSATRSLTLIAPATEGYSWSEEWTRKMRAITAAAANGDTQAAKQLWLAHELFMPARRDPRHAAALASMVERYSAWHWHHFDPVQRPDAPSIMSLAAISCPTLVIIGELDLPDFKAIAARLSAGIPHATLRIIKDAGHMANMEAPAVVNSLILGHLRAHAQVTRPPPD